MPQDPESPITLGGLQFSKYEIPENVRFNPTQNVVIHKFIGGARHMDVLGEDSDTIKWAGTFLSPDAGDRARLLNEYVIDGEPQVLTFGEFNYDVVVKQCAFDYKSPFRIDYAIECYTQQNGLTQEDGQANAAALQGLVDAAGAVGNGVL